MPVSVWIIMQACHSPEILQESWNVLKVLKNPEFLKFLKNVLKILILLFFRTKTFTFFSLKSVFFIFITDFISFYNFYHHLIWFSCREVQFFFLNKTFLKKNVGLRKILEEKMLDLEKNLEKMEDFFFPQSFEFYYSFTWI